MFGGFGFAAAPFAAVFDATTEFVCPIVLPWFSREDNEFQESTNPSFFTRIDAAPFTQLTPSWYNKNDEDWRCP